MRKNRPESVHIVRKKLKQKKKVRPMADIEKELRDLIATVEMACNPPTACNDPEILKTYMKGCLVQAQKAYRATQVPLNKTVKLSRPP